MTAAPVYATVFLFLVHTQIKSKDGTYVSVPPVPGAVLVMLGDTLQDWTNNKLFATVSSLLLIHSFTPRPLKRNP